LKKGPWYNYYNEWNEKALKYLEILAKIRFEERLESEIDAFTEFNIAKVIFESNLIEGAGLKEGDTRKIISEHFPQVPSNYFQFKEARNSLGEDHMVLLDISNKIDNLVEKFKSDQSDLLPHLYMGSKTRGEKEVIQHHIAILKSQIIVTTHIIYHLIDQARLSKEEKTKSFNSAKKTFDSLKKAGLDYKNIVTEKNIKNLHRTMAESQNGLDKRVVLGAVLIFLGGIFLLSSLNILDFHAK